MTQEERLIGSWEFFLIVCNKRVAERAPFILNITKETITMEGNQVECNSCFANYSLQGNQIIFDKSGMACTELECEHRSTFCEKEETSTFLFNNMEFGILGDELTLTKGDKSIVLTRSEN